MTQTPLDQVRELLDSLQPIAPGAYWLYAENKELKLSRLPEIPEDAQRIALLTTSDLEGKIPLERRNRLDSKIRSLRERGEL